MGKELNTNNSKKLIIGISILFCTVVLIIGGTFAFFTQSSSESTGNIVSSNDNNAYINYIEEKSMMLDNLIPMKGEDVYNAIDNGCVDDNGYSACSIYMFSLENTYGEVQKINISMIPTANSFTNLKYIVAKMGTDGLPNIITDEPLSLEKNNLNPISLIENEILYSGQENIGTYAILFYIESMDYDQTKEDAGKHFGASIRVDSLTTGKYIVESFGDSCWDLELVEGTIDEYKLTKFKGIENSIIYDSEGNSTFGEDKGVVKEECEMYATKDGVDGYYTINIPSSIGGNKITTLGNSLFSALTLDLDYSLVKTNSYRFIKEVNVDNGIKNIEDSPGGKGTFLNVGIKEDLSSIIDNFKLKVNLPNTLEYIGDYSMTGAITEITIPKSVKRIGNEIRVFSTLTKITFEGAEDNTSNLKYIGTQAFYKNALDYQDGNNPLVIPSSVMYIGNEAFSSNAYLKFIKYTGTNLSSFGISWNGRAEIITE